MFAQLGIQMDHDPRTQSRPTRRRRRRRTTTTKATRTRRARSQQRPKLGRRQSAHFDSWRNRGWHRRRSSKAAKKEVDRHPAPKESIGWMCMGQVSSLIGQCADFRRDQKKAEEKEATDIEEKIKSLLDQQEKMKERHKKSDEVHKAKMVNLNLALAKAKEQAPEGAWDGQAAAAPTLDPNADILAKEFAAWGASVNIPDHLLTFVQGMASMAERFTMLEAKMQTNSAAGPGQKRAGMDTDEDLNGETMPDWRTGPQA